MVWLDIDALVATFLDVLLPRGRVGLYSKTTYTILDIQTLEYIFIHYILAIKNVITMVPVQAVQLLQKLRRGSNRRLIYSQLG